MSGDDKRPDIDPREEELVERLKFARASLDRMIQQGRGEVDAVRARIRVIEDALDAVRRARHRDAGGPSSRSER